MKQKAQWLWQLRINTWGETTAFLISSENLRLTLTIYVDLKILLVSVSDTDTCWTGFPSLPTALKVNSELNGGLQTFVDLFFEEEFGHSAGHWSERIILLLNQIM